MINIIIINWNSGSQLAKAVASILQFDQSFISSIIIVDNNSTDDSLAQVEVLGALPFELKIIRNIENRGFGVACNQGAAEADGKFILFLNPDTYLFKDSLSIPLNFMQKPENATVGIVGIQLLDEDNHISRSCARFPSLSIFVAQALGVNHLPGLRHVAMHMKDWGHEQTATVDHVIGAFYLIRRSLFESLGGFDERFFLYLEDLDLSLRARQAGWRCMYLTDAQAFHAGGGTSQQVMATRLFYSLRSRLLYGFKHFSTADAWWLLLITFAIEPWSRLAFAFLKGAWRDIGHTTKAYVQLTKNLSEVIRR